MDYYRVILIPLDNKEEKIKGVIMMDRRYVTCKSYLYISIFCVEWF